MLFSSVRFRFFLTQISCFPQLDFCYLGQSLPLALLSSPGLAVNENYDIDNHPLKVGKYEFPELAHLAGGATTPGCDRAGRLTQNIDLEKYYQLKQLLSLSTFEKAVKKRLI